VTREKRRVFRPSRNCQIAALGRDAVKVSRTPTPQSLSGRKGPARAARYARGRSAAENLVRRRVERVRFRTRWPSEPPSASDAESTSIAPLTLPPAGRATDGWHRAPSDSLGDPVAQVPAFQRVGCSASKQPVPVPGGRRATDLDCQGGRPRSSNLSPVPTPLLGSNQGRRTGTNASCARLVSGRPRCRQVGGSDRGKDGERRSGDADQVGLGLRLITGKSE
jgi:hypothetical protein